MLVLERRITIGSDIEITVVDIRGGKVRFGIDAPKNIAVHRMEVQTKINEAREAACMFASDVGGRVLCGMPGSVATFCKNPMCCACYTKEETND